MSDDLDVIDQHLRAELRGVALRVPSEPDAMLDALTPRFRRARRRHRTVLVTSVAAVLVAFVLGVVALFGPAGGPGRDVQVPPAASTQQTRPAPTVSTDAPTDAPTTSTPEPTTSTVPANDGAVASAPPAPTGVTSGPPASDATTPATPPPAPVEHTYSSAGGSVTVRVADGALSILSTAPAPGYTEERHDTGSDRVEVRFHDADGEWRIRVDLVNGEPVEETTHH